MLQSGKSADEKEGKRAAREGWKGRQEKTKLCNVWAWCQGVLFIHKPPSMSNLRLNNLLLLSPREKGQKASLTLLLAHFFLCFVLIIFLFSLLDFPLLF